MGKGGYGVYAWVRGGYGVYVWVRGGGGMVFTYAIVP
jgi:hypothetical protein